MTMNVEQIKAKYPGALSWSFGDSPELANELATLVLTGKKIATCSSLQGWYDDDVRPLPGGYNIILDGEKKPLCVVRTTGLFLTRFDRVTPEMAWP